MKDILKCAGLLAVGLFVAIIAYPFLHESGHFLAALFLGEKVVEYSIFPTPYVICEMSLLSEFNVVLIGLAGMYLPMIITFIVRPKCFWLWYGILVTKGICLLSFALSFIAIVLYYFGIVIANEDVIRVIDICEKGNLNLAILMLLTMIITIYSISKQKPLSRILRYFDVPTKKASAV